MSIFSFLNKSTAPAPTENQSNNDIPEDLFIEKSNQSELNETPKITNIDTVANSNQKQTHSINDKIVDIEGLYLFLQNNWEENGFNDALANPDDSYRKDNLEFLTIDFELKVDQLLLTYSDKLNEIEFHINTRSKAGLIDLVEELKQHTVKLKTHVDQLNKFKSEIPNGTGALKRILLSYNKGFLRGLNAISVSKFLN
jgi:hypothetical protein